MVQQCLRETKLKSHFLVCVCRASTYSSLAMSLSTMGLNMSTPASPDGVSIGSASSDSAHPVTSQSSISSGDSEVLQPDRRVIRVSLLLKGQSEVNYKSMIVSR